MARFLQPVQGRISSPFGGDRGDHMHGGVDIAAACGTPVLAAAAGRVTAARYSDTAGNMVIVDHGGGLDTRYFHLSGFAVRVGANVVQGEVIGYVGNTGRSTGCHLHWEVRRNGKAVNPFTADAPQTAPPPQTAPSWPAATSSGGDGSNLPVSVYASGGGDKDEGDGGGGLALAVLAVVVVWLFF